MTLTPVATGRSPHVLIETYWNVNSNSCRICCSSSCVLIETYWNVNAFKPNEETTVTES